VRDYNPNNKKRLPPKGRNDDREDSSKRGGRTSLRIGTGGRKGRSAELSQRRGSLKKRDRSFEKQARADAALERKTVYLPEYVLYCLPSRNFLCVFVTLVDKLVL
jgi:hypothetical protein